MIFSNPWAWLGLLAIAAPIAAHLLARRPARRQAFPHLRFLPPPSANPVRRGRLSDPALLALRVLVIAAAVAALAQPLWLSDDRMQGLASQIARAIVIEAAASSESDLPAAVREISAREAEEGTTSRTRIVATPGPTLAAAATWLEAQPMRRELVLVVDPAWTTLSRADIDTLPAHIGIRIVPASIPREALTTSSPPPMASIGLLAGAADQAAAEAARSAALAIGAPATGRADRPVAIVFPSHENYAAAAAGAAALTQPWMYDVVAAVTADPLVRETGVVVTPRALERRGLQLLLSVRPHDVAAAAVIAATMRAVAPMPGASPAARRDALTEEEMRAWARPPADAPITSATQTGDLSDGRWAWLLVLAGLAVEAVVRRRARTKTMDTEAPHARVA